MAKYTIDPTLYAKALSELERKWRQRSPGVSEAQIQQAARTAFSQAWHFAVRHHEECAPMTAHDVEEPESLKRLAACEELSPKLRESLARSRQTLSNSRESVHQAMLENHRTGLIKLFTMDDGIGKDVAEQIVDNHILIHQK